MFNSIRRALVRRKLRQNLQTEAWIVEITAAYERRDIVQHQKEAAEEDIRVEKLLLEAKGLEESHKREDRDRRKELEHEAEEAKKQADSLRQKISIIESKTGVMLQKVEQIHRQCEFIKNFR